MVFKRSKQPQEVVVNRPRDLANQTGKKRVLASFASLQSLPLVVEQDPDGTTWIGGPVHAARWDDIDDLANVAREVLVRTGTFQDTGLCLESALLSTQDGWIPKVSIVTVAEELQEPEHHLVRSLVPVVMDCLVRGEVHHVKRIDSDLTEEQMQVVHTVTTNSLSSKGGRVLQAAVDVHVLGESMAKIKGKLGPKPDRSDFSPQPLDLRGVCVGFHVGGEVIFFVDDTRGEVKLGFGRTQLDLLQLARLVKDRQKVDVRAHRTINKSGAEMLAFVAFKEVSVESGDASGLLGLR